MRSESSSDISIIIPVVPFDEDIINMTGRCIDKVRENTECDYELIIVESGDDISCCKFNPDIYVYVNERKCFSENVNLGFSVSCSDKIVVLSNDVFVDRGWDRALLDVFNVKSDCGISTLLSSEFCQPVSDNIDEQYWGAMWMIDREALNKVGYMDERFKNSFCDADYWVRTYKEGYKIYRNNKIMVGHLVKATANKDPFHAKKYEENRALFNKKHENCNLRIFDRLK